MLKQFESYIRGDVKPLKMGNSVLDAARRLSDEGLTDLPVVDMSGIVRGIFGEKEVIGSFFPAYLEELSDTTFVATDFEDIAEDARKVMDEPVERFMRTEFATLPEDFSAIHCAELFLHRRQGVIPLVKDGRPIGLIRRSDLGRIVLDIAAGKAGNSSK